MTVVVRARVDGGVGVGFSAAGVIFVLIACFSHYLGMTILRKSSERVAPTAGAGVDEKRKISRGPSWGCHVVDGKEPSREAVAIGGPGGMQEATDENESER